MTWLTVRPSTKDVTRPFESLFEDFFNLPALRRWDVSDSFLPKVDIRETEEEVELTFEIPGMKRDDIKVTLNGDQLTISGERKLDREDKDSGYVRREISTGSFSRSFTLPDYVNRDKISADYKDGLLTVGLAKLEEVKPKEIEVKVK